jgi:flagellar biosynthesis protein FlhA
MRTIAETLSLQRGVEKSPDEMVSQVRVALGPSIFQSVTGQAHELPVMVLDPQLEQIMGNAIQNNNGVIEPNLLDTVVTGIGEGSGKMEAEGASPVLLVSGAIRGFLARLLRGRMANFYILAYDEIPADKNIRVVTTVGKQSA